MLEKKRCSVNLEWPMRVLTSLQWKPQTLTEVHLSHQLREEKQNSLLKKSEQYYIFRTFVTLYMT